jgi:hypothetical protein
MAQGLHSQTAWEELAEDPFRGLRAGPATFSPFLFLPTSKTIPLILQRVQSGCLRRKWRNAQKHTYEDKAKEIRVSFRSGKMPNARSETTAKTAVRLAGFGLVQHGAWNNPPT